MTVTIRERRPEDLPRLAELLTEQQAASSYPIRWPLPVSVEEFLMRPTELRAWVAEVDGDLVGHVTTAQVDEPLVPLFEVGTGATHHEMVSVLFTGARVRGQGYGGRLLDTAVDWIRGRGAVPVLDVVPVHDTAVAVYLGRGWVEVGRSRFFWMDGDLPDVVLMALPPYPAMASSTPP